MKRFESQHRLGALLKGLVALALSVGCGAVAAQGIVSTRHNLSTSNTITGANKLAAGGTAEVCVFCHTPHAAVRPVGVESPPLWNKNIPSGATYNTYSTLNSSSIQGQVLPVGSISLACLSCHDGTQAMDNIVNAPGSGGLSNGGGAIGLTGAAWSWTGSTRVDADGRLTGVANLGPDLRDDHPIGIQYCGGGINATGGTCNDADFRTPATATINGQRVWWVDTGGTQVGTREKGDMSLYSRDFGAPAGVGPAVECGSCHDPHVGPGQAAGTGRVTGATFLRISNDASAVCLSCHNK